MRGGFNWGLQFKWRKMPEYEQKRRGYDETREVKSPTMAGGLFSIERDYFYEIGSYDLGMDIWGAENLEISFRVSELSVRIGLLKTVVSAKPYKVKILSKRPEILKMFTFPSINCYLHIRTYISMHVQT